MPKYIYKAKKGPKDIVEGTIEAETYNGAIDKLAKMGYFPISVKEEDLAAQPQDNIASILRKKIRLSDLSIFTSQLSELLGSGVPLLQGLQVLSRQTENKRLQIIINDLSKTIQEGGTLSDGLAKYPKVFSSLYINITRSGELGGKLEYTLGRLAGFLDKEEEMISRIQQAMAYPALMCTVGLVTILVLMTIVIPRLVVMFEDIGQALPLPTLILIGTSNILLKYWWFIVLTVVSVIFLVRRRVKKAEVKLRLDKLKLKLPAFGALIKKIEIARLSRTLATLLDSGISILPAMEAVTSTVQNEAIKSELEKARHAVRDGASLGKSLEDAVYIPPYVINMITVGEEGGRLESVLFKVASSYEIQADKAIRVFITLLEPVLILIILLYLVFLSSDD